MRQVHNPKNISLTDLEITDAIATIRSEGWSKWDQENGSKQAGPKTSESIRRRRKLWRKIVRFKEMSF